MVGEVDIVNMALGRLGEDAIQSLDEGSATSLIAKTFYDMSRRATLRDYDWNFAITQAKLQLLSQENFDFTYAYALPNDLIRAIKLYSTTRKGQEVGFVVRENKLFCNEEGVYLEYIKDEETPNNFDDKFIEAFSYKLASEMAIAIGGKENLMQTYLEIYQGLVSKASQLTEAEDKEVLSDNPYLEARWL